MTDFDGNINWKCIDSYREPCITQQFNSQSPCLNSIFAEITLEHDPEELSTFNFKIELCVKKIILSMYLLTKGNEN